MAPIPSSGIPARPRTSAVRNKIARETMLGGTMLTTRTVLISGARLAWLGAICFVASGFQAPAPSAKQPAATATPAGELAKNYCVSCHNQKLKTGNVMLDQ